MFTNKEIQDKAAELERVLDDIVTVAKTLKVTAMERISKIYDERVRDENQES